MIASHQYGVLLPHFGDQASRQRLIAGSRRLEELGFDSVWVRDHIVYHPHDYEGQDRTHVDPFVTLSAVAGATERLILGTASMIPHRHPVHAALVIASLDFVAGPGRVIIGLGLGTFQHEFDAVGLAGVDRRELVPEQIEIFRKLWTGETVSHQGKHYQFKDVDIHPVPSGHVPIWYCGVSKAALRRTVEFCDGWLPGVMPYRDFEVRVEWLRQRSEAAGKSLPPIGMVPLVVPARTVEEAIKYIHLPSLLEFANRAYLPPPSGAYRTLEDLDGMVLYGPPERIAEQVRRWQDLGVSHMVFDLRLRFDAYEAWIESIAKEVMPRLEPVDDTSKLGAR